MQDVLIDKVTLNIGIGQGGERLQNAKVLLERITGKTAILTKAKVRNPTFKIKPGDNIGAKVTLRKKLASDVLKRALDVVDFQLKEKSFDKFGNVAFGVPEYIDFPGMKYDPKIGMMGFDVCITLSKRGSRVAKRRIAKSRIPGKQKVSSSEAMEFVSKNFNVKVVKEEKEE